jgi:hypothetical protein
MPENDKYYGDSEFAKENAGVLDRYDSNDAVYKGLIELKQNASRSMLMPDSKLEGDERITAHKEVMHKLGAPKETDGMNMGDVEMIGSWGEEGMKVYKELAVDASLQPWQAKKVYDAFAKSEKAGNEAAEKQRAEAEAGLKTDWGTEYEPNIKGCESLIDKYGKDDNLLEDLKSVPMALKVKLMKMVNRMQSDFIKDGSLPGSGGLTSQGAPPLLDYNKVDI